MYTVLLILIKHSEFKKKLRLLDFMFLLNNFVFFNFFSKELLEKNLAFLSENDNY